MRILLVEDNPSDIILAREGLKDAGFEGKLHVERDGDAAIHYLEYLLDHYPSHLPNLILLDLNLPRRHGLDVLRAIRENELLHHLPVALLSTSEHEIDVLQAYEFGGNCYLTKPLEFSRFVMTLRGVISFFTRHARQAQPKPTLS
ncbi:MAG: response regulator [Bacteroidota bacterium]